MDFAPGRWDLLLIGVVSLQVAVVAYLRPPHWKALGLTLPFPFTIIALSQERPLDATNVLSLIVLLLYVHSIRLFHYRLRLPIGLAIPLSLSGYSLISWTAVRLLPLTPAAFWITCAAVFLLGLGLHLLLSTRDEPDHRTSLPIWLKLPLIVAVVCLLLLIKESLQGFATLFPLVGVVGAYEARHSLWTFGRQMPVFMLTFLPLLIVAYLTQDRFGLGPALLLGWIAFLLVLLPLTRRLWRKAGKTP